MTRNRHFDNADRYAASRYPHREEGGASERFGREIFTGGLGRSSEVEDTERDREQRFRGAWPAEETSRDLENRHFFDEAVRDDYRGRGPKNFRRNDERIAEEVVRALTDAAEVDATDIEVQVENGDVTLGGHVPTRNQKRLAADLAEWCFGVRNVFNQLRVSDPQNDALRSRDVSNRR